MGWLINNILVFFPFSSTLLQVTVPEVVDLYNKGMGGVDLADQMIDNYAAV